MRTIIVYVIVGIIAVLSCYGAFALSQGSTEPITEKPNILESPAENVLLIGMSNFKVTIDPTTNLQSYTPSNPAIWIVHPEQGWSIEKIPVQGESKVIHKVIAADMDGDGKNEIYAMGGQISSLYRYDKKNEAWVGTEISTEEVFFRLRDVEKADLDRDGKDELIIGTHIPAQVFRVDYENGNYVITKLWESSDRLIHEVEVVDIDNNGEYEIFWTPTDKNTATNVTQGGAVMMAKWNGQEYVVTTIDEYKDIHSKEIVLGDINNDGIKELFAFYLGRTVESKAEFPGGGIADVAVPLKVRMYSFTASGIKGEDVCTIEGEYKTRTAAIADINYDGKNDLVIGTEQSGVQYLTKEASGWKRTVIDPDLIGNVHALLIADFNNDGKNEVIANSDLMGTVRQYSWNGFSWEIKEVFRTPDLAWVWAFDYNEVNQ